MIPCFSKLCFERAVSGGGAKANPKKMAVLKPFLATDTAHRQGALEPLAPAERTQTRTARAGWLWCPFGLPASAYSPLSHSVTAQMLPLISQTLPQTRLTRLLAPASRGCILNTSATRQADSLVGIVARCSSRGLRSASSLHLPAV